MTIIASSLIVIAPYLPSDGTILLTHNLFLRNHDRFEFHDVSRQFSYSFTPQFLEDARYVSLSPSGNRLAVATVADGEFFVNITSIDGQQLIDPFRTSSGVRFGDWSPDERYFIYYKVDSVRFSDIFALDTLTGESYYLATTWVSNATSAWSSDSQQLAFTHGLDPSNPQIWIVKQNGDDLRQITEDEQSSICPTWSPDNSAIAHFIPRDDGVQLRVIDINTRQTTMVSQQVWSSITCPSWSPDSNYITFIAFERDSFSANVTIVDTVTGEARKLFDVQETALIRWWQ